MTATRTYYDIDAAYRVIRKIRKRGYAASLTVNASAMATVTFHAPKKVLAKI